MRNFGVQLVPPVLVGAVRNVLNAQGLPSSILSDSGELDTTALVTLGFDKVEVRTALTPPVVVDLKGPSDPAATELLKTLQPAVILSGRAGRATIAPHGVPSGTGVTATVKKAGLSIGLGLAAGLVGGILFGRALVRR